MKRFLLTHTTVSSAVLMLTLISSTAEAVTARLTDFKVIPHQVVGGNEVTLMLTFDRPGFAKPILTSADPNVVPVPGTINKADHQVSITQRVRTRAVNAQKTVEIRAIWGNVTRTQNLIVNPRRPGAFNLRAPANNAIDRTGRPLFQWNAAARAATYTLCIVTDDQQPACRNADGVARMFDGITQTERRPSDLREFDNQQVIWFVRACNVTGCTNSESRFLRIAPPLVSFRQHLYPLISSNDCGSCHVGDNLYPQKLGPQDNPNTNLNENTASIPFNTSITASVMLGRFRGLAARSTQGAYAQALGKTYVVTRNIDNSGLHWKAKNSTAPIFGSNQTIGGQTRPLREWIQIWIEQGANL